MTTCAANDTARHESGAFVLVLQSQFLADQRQHGGIGEMENHAAEAEDQKAPAAHEHAETRRFFLRFGKPVVKTTGEVVVYRRGSNGEDAHDRKQSHARDKIEDDDWPP